MNRDEELELHKLLSALEVTLAHRSRALGRAAILARGLRDIAAVTRSSKVRQIAERALKDGGRFDE